ncbi:MAG: 16S rRNA (cytosine(1402)-N(4))-methyltransferase RsmH, partial [Pseudomonadales bacterium]
SVTPSPKVLAIELDPSALEVATARVEAYADNVTLVRGSYADVGEIGPENGFSSVDGLLMDLGISSRQIDTGERGFSFQYDAPLDMRFDTSQALSAHDIVNNYSEEDLANVIYEFGEERKSRRIARTIVRNRPVETTGQLAELVVRAIGRPRKGRIHPATRTFQGIRIAVNGELDNLSAGLNSVVSLLSAGGRLVVIAYHSLEDRIVKNFMRKESSDCICPPEAPQCVCDHVKTLRLVSRRVIQPTSEEVEANPRSRSAKLRVAERV